MRKSHAPNLRRVLGKHPNGMLASEIAQALGIRTDVARVAMSNMPDVYIDHWRDDGLGMWSAVYRAVQVPNDAPHPLTLKEK